jgi:hypothetical protein
LAVARTPWLREATNPWANMAMARKIHHFYGWLVVFLNHLEKWWSSSMVGRIIPYMENKIPVWNHQPDKSLSIPRKSLENPYKPYYSNHQPEHNCNIACLWTAFFVRCFEKNIIGTVYCHCDLQRIERLSRNLHSW